MKARIKATGEILKIAEYATIAMENCDSYGTPLEYSPEEIELIDDTVSQSKIDWEQRRFELVNAAMQGLCSNSAYVSNNDATVDIASYAVSQADAIIAKYKKGKFGIVLTPDDIGTIFDLVRKNQVKYSATSGCYEEVLEEFNKQKSNS